MLLERAANRKAAAKKRLAKEAARAAREAEKGPCDETDDEPKHKKPPAKVRGWGVHCYWQVPNASFQLAFEAPPHILTHIRDTAADFSKCLRHTLYTYVEPELS